VTCSGGGGAPPNDTLTEQAPPDIAGWRGVLSFADVEVCTPAPSLDQARPVEDH
jgi:hypothetical protein